MKRKPKSRPHSERRRGKQGRTANPIAKEREENKASPPAPLQGEGSRMLRKWRAKRAQLGGQH
jgi:hypothetical protein